MIGLLELDDYFHGDIPAHESQTGVRELFGQSYRQHFTPSINQHRIHTFDNGSGAADHFAVTPNQPAPSVFVVIKRAGQQQQFRMRGRELWQHKPDARLIINQFVMERPQIVHFVPVKFVQVEHQPAFAARQ